MPTFPIMHLRLVSVRHVHLPFYKKRILPERCSHDAAISRTCTGAGIIVVHAEVMTHLMS